MTSIALVKMKMPPSHCQADSRSCKKITAQNTDNSVSSGVSKMTWLPPM